MEILKTQIKKGSSIIRYHFSRYFDLLFFIMKCGPSDRIDQKKRTAKLGEIFNRIQESLITKMSGTQQPPPAMKKKLGTS